MKAPLEIITHRTLPPGWNLPVYEKPERVARPRDATRAHAPSVLKYTPVQVACLPDTRPEEAPVGFRYRPEGSAQVFETTLLDERAVDAGYALELVDEDHFRLRALATEVRRVNHVNNWARDFEVADLPARLELIHTEVSEAYRAESTPARIDELGDTVVRTLDLLALLDGSVRAVPWSDLPEDAFGVWFGEWEPLLLRLHDQTDLAMEAYRKGADLDQAVKAVTIHLCKVVALAWGGMLYLGAAAPVEVLTRLVRQNAVRGLTHGGRRL